MKRHQFKKGDRVAIYGTYEDPELGILLPIKRYGVVAIIYYDGLLGFNAIPGKKPLFVVVGGKKQYDLTVAHPKQCRKLK